jgi:hypothetical protein
MVFGFGGSGDKYEALNPSGEPVQLDMSSGMSKLAGLDRIEVKQRMSKLEAMCSLWESKNKYDIYDGGSQIFYAEEKTGCCCRQVQNTLPDCAPIQVDIDYVGGWTRTTDYGAFKMKKDFTCVMCCINRPVVEVLDKEDNKIGSIKDPCPLCPTNMTFDVRDHNGDVILSAASGICQWGLCCPCPLGPCKTVEFPITDSDGNQVGVMTKKMKGLMKMCLCSSCFEDVENYTVAMKDVDNPRAKALLMALAIFTDFRYFQNTGTDEVAPE